MNIICRFVLVVAFFFCSNVIFGQACEERTVIDGYLVIKDSLRTIVTVPDGPESLSDYSASYIIADEYKHIYAENAADKDWSQKYDYRSMSETLGELVRHYVPVEYLPGKGRINISCIVSLSGRIDMISYFVKEREESRWISCHLDIPADIYIKLDKAIKENIRFPSWKDKVPYKYPTIAWYF